MERSWRRWCCASLTALFLGPAASYGQSVEELAHRSGLDFTRAVGAPAASKGFELRAVIGPVLNASNVPGKDDFEKYMREHVQLTSKDSEARGSPVLAGDIELAKILNKQWKTSIQPKMGGVAAYISGAFDRQQNAFVSVYQDGAKEPAFFNIKSLLEKEGTVKVGNAIYTVSLSANPIKPLKSQIVFENQADENDSNRVTVKKLLDEIAAVGATVKLTDQSYQTFYFNDVKTGPSGPALDPDSKTFAMVLTEGEDLHVFLIPAETVPSDKIAVFKMHNNKKVGLQTKDGFLKIYELP